MAGDPTILNVTNSGSNTATATPAVAYPAYSAGDLVVLSIFIDDDDVITFPATGPDSETIVSIYNGDSGSAAGPALAACYFIGGSTQSASTIAFGIGGGGENWLGRSYRVAAGDFNAANPIDSVSAVGGSSTDSNDIPTAAFTASANAEAGTMVVAVAADADPQLTTETGFTSVTYQDIGAVSGQLWTRDAAVTASESIGSTTFNLTSTNVDTTSCFCYVINAAAGGAINTVTINTGQSLTVTDNNVELRQRTRSQSDTSVIVDNAVVLRLRDRAQVNSFAVTDTDTAFNISPRILSDSVIVTDSHAELRERIRSQLDTSVVVDDSVELRERTRSQSDTSVITDPAPTATYVPAGGAINTVTISEYIQKVSDAVWIPLVFSTARRERNRAQVDAITVEDVKATWIQNEQGQVETIDIADDSIEGRFRNRALFDSIIVLDDKTAIYVPATSGAINNVTLQDLDSCVVIDGHTELRFRTRAQIDSAVVVDFDVELRLRDRSQADNFAITDTAVASRLRDRLKFDEVGAVQVSGVVDSHIELRERNRTQADNFEVTDFLGGPVISTVLFDSLVSVDDSIELRLRYRTLSDSIVVLDDKTATYVAPGSQIVTRTLQDLDSATVTDNHIELRLRDRAQVDSAVVVDFDVSFNISPRVLFESAVVIDNHVELRERNRQETDSVDVTDAIAGPVISTVLRDSITVSDGSTPLRERPKQLTDSIDVSETVASVRERIRTLSDVIEVTDGTIVTVDTDISVVTLSDTLSVVDSIIAEVVTDAGQFFVTHGIETLNADHGVTLQFHINQGISEETS